MGQHTVEPVGEAEAVALAGFDNAGGGNFAHKGAVPVSDQAFRIAPNTPQFFLHKAADLGHVRRKVSIRRLQGCNSFRIILQQAQGQPARSTVGIGRGCHTLTCRNAFFHGFQYGVEQGAIAYAQG